MMIKTLFLLSFLFFIYSFIGWILEVVQSAFHQKRLVNRGFINSPLCISYGIGAIVITINTHQMTGTIPISSRCCSAFRSPTARRWPAVS